ncbi:uncharacterized protein NEMAJ01_1259 [Nematocida major]|uniref:uncharacterized protein n=1 Tax=Nematocida major TaxID=1912982 RepID=UPI002007ECCE|nr:uncharacterized protein NEMAJ01_1259 [Nematocida major]KAH9386363.1 hypothetical protein NEMAJ01_1259 [Nematocida major]
MRDLKGFCKCIASTCLLLWASSAAASTACSPQVTVEAPRKSEYSQIINRLGKFIKTVLVANQNESSLKNSIAVSQLASQLGGIKCQTEEGVSFYVSNHIGALYYTNKNPMSGTTSGHRLAMLENLESDDKRVCIPFIDAEGHNDWVHSILDVEEETEGIRDHMLLAQGIRVILQNLYEIQKNAISMNRKRQAQIITKEIAMQEIQEIKENYDIMLQNLNPAMAQVFFRSLDQSMRLFLENRAKELMVQIIHDSISQKPTGKFSCNVIQAMAKDIVWANTPAHLCSHKKPHSSGSRSWITESKIEGGILYIRETFLNPKNETISEEKHTALIKTLKELVLLLSLQKVASPGEAGGMKNVSLEKVLSRANYNTPMTSITHYAETEEEMEEAIQKCGVNTMYVHEPKTVNVSFASLENRTYMLNGDSIYYLPAFGEDSTNTMKTQDEKHVAVHTARVESYLKEKISACPNGGPLKQIDRYSLTDLFSKIVEDNTFKLQSGKNSIVVTPIPTSIGVIGCAQAKDADAGIVKRAHVMYKNPLFASAPYVQYNCVQRNTIHGEKVFSVIELSSSQLIHGNSMPTGRSALFNKDAYSPPHTVEECFSARKDAVVRILNHVLDDGSYNLGIPNGICIKEVIAKIVQYLGTACSSHCDLSVEEAADFSVVQFGTAMCILTSVQKSLKEAFQNLDAQKALDMKFFRQTPNINNAPNGPIANVLFEENNVTEVVCKSIVVALSTLNIESVFNTYRSAFVCNKTTHLPSLDMYSDKLAASIPVFEKSMAKSTKFSGQLACLDMHVIELGSLFCGNNLGRKIARTNSTLAHKNPSPYTSLVLECVTAFLTLLNNTANRQEYISFPSMAISCSSEIRPFLEILSKIAPVFLL